MPNDALIPGGARSFSDKIIDNVLLKGCCPLYTDQSVTLNTLTTFILIDLAVHMTSHYLNQSGLIPTQIMQYTWNLNSNSMSQIWIQIQFNGSGQDCCNSRAHALELTVVMNWAKEMIYSNSSYLFAIGSHICSGANEHLYPVQQLWEDLRLSISISELSLITNVNKMQHNQN